MDNILVTTSSDPTSYPLWMLFNIPLLKKTGEFHKSIPQYPVGDGTRFAPIFTDKDLAVRFLEENPLQPDGNEVMPLENLDRLCYILQLYRNVGVTHVGTDWSSRQFGTEPQYGQLRTIDGFLKQVGK